MSLKPILKGENPALDWRRINETIAAVQALQTEARRLSSAVVDLRGRKPPVSAGGGRVQQFKVVSIGDDTLTCHTYEGTTEGTDAITVLKPYLLRKTTYNGVTRTLPNEWGEGDLAVTYTYQSAQARKGTVSSVDENQVITPRYLAGDIIYGAQVTGAAADWVDLNVDGRAWARI